MPQNLHVFSTHKVNNLLDNLDRVILEGEEALKTLGKETMTAVAQAELIDSSQMYEDYLATMANKLDKEEGQQLVYTENMGFKIINIPQSLMFWARRKQEKTVCLIKPNSMILLQKSVQALAPEQTEDLYRMAIVNLLMDSIIWMVKHAKLGCKYCNRTSELQVMPALYHSLKNSRLGSKSLAGEEEYIARRIADVIRLPANKGKVHDVVIPKKMIRTLVQQIYKNPDFLNAQELTTSEYIKRFSSDISIQTQEDSFVYSKVVMLTSIIIKNNPGAKE